MIVDLIASGDDSAGSGGSGGGCSGSGMNSENNGSIGSTQKNRQHTTKSSLSAACDGANFAVAVAVEVIKAVDGKEDKSSVKRKDNTHPMVYGRK